MKKNIAIIILLFCVSLYAKIGSTDNSSGKDIENPELKSLEIDNSYCDEMKDRYKCAESLISAYNKDNNLYASISFSDFESEFFDSTYNSPDEVIELSVSEAEEAEENQDKQIDLFANLISTSSVEADIISRQELINKKLKKMLSRVNDLNSANLLTLSTKTKAKIAILQNALNDEIFKSVNR